MAEKINHNPNREQLLNILDILNDGVYVVNRDYDVEHANAAFVQEFGPYDGKKCYHYLCDENKPCPQCRLDEVLAGETVRGEWKCAKTGRIYDTTDAPLKNADGSISKIKIIHDITETTQNRRQIRDLAKFPEENPFPVLRIAADGTILYSNTPGMVLVEEWGRKIGQTVTENWQAVITETLTQNRYHVEEIRCGQKLFLFAVAPVTEGGYVNLYGRDITKQKQTEDALRTSEQRIRRKMETILSPEGDIGQLELEDILDVPAVQILMEHFYELSHIPMAIIDMAGKVLIGVGWQEICTKFHRVNPQTCAYCIESDLELSAGAKEGEFKLYKCRNNLWDAATPVIIGGKKMGNLFTGQFFFEDEKLDYDLFRRQAEEYGFDETAYIAALENVPRLSHDALNRGMEFLHELSKMISQLSYGNLKLARLISERDRLTDSLRKSEMRYRQLVETATEGIWQIDNEFRTTFVNPRMAQMLGYSPEEMVGRPISEFMADDETDDVKQRSRNRLNGISEQYERQLRRKDGSVVWALVSAVPLHDEKNKICGSFGMFTDITNRKQAEEALRESESRFRTIFEGNTDGMLITDRQSKQFLMANEAICRMLGYSRDEIQQLGVTDIHPREDLPFVMGHFEKLAGGQKTTSEDIPMKRKDGGVFFADITATPINLFGKTYLVGSIRDVTERKRAEEKLRENFEELRRFNQVAVDRELRMIELKKEINTLCDHLNLPTRYPMNLQDGTPSV